MNRYWRWLLVPVLAGTGLSTGVAVHAQRTRSPYPPVSTPGPAQGPHIGVFAHGTGAQGASIIYPTDFHFIAQIAGAAFKPAEHIVVSATHTVLHPLALTADSSGAFSTQVNLTWVFCGPSGQAQSAPVFSAVGNQGSRADVQLAAPRCPLLVPRSNQVSPAPIQKPVGGQPQPVYTAVVISPGTTPPPNSPPAPIASSQPASFSMEGFGFVPGESVIIQTTGGVPSGTAAPVHATADAEGRISFTIQLTLPSPCGAAVPRLIATGNKGTAVEAPLFIAPMALCPNHSAGGPEPAPPTGGSSSTASFSLTVHPATVRRGQITHIRLQAPAAGNARLVLRYAGNRTVHRTVSIGQKLTAALTWHIARGIRAGKGTLSATIGGSTLVAPIMIR